MMCARGLAGVWVQGRVALEGASRDSLLSRVRRGLIQDHVVSGVLLTKRDTWLTRDMYTQLVYIACSAWSVSVTGRGFAATAGVHCVECGSGREGLWC